ncbi:6-pyruvoyl trahydropterin synthase family protein [Nitrosopumilus sp.]|uniref:6-pyruvoyl trahydropterin synthase family protein n=1 Tax=Nitrosopumilus sp. TaxID=2024843 RepID=UPI003B599669
MTSNPTILDSDFRYIDKKGNLLQTRTELTVAQMLDFLEEEYQYNYKVILKNGKEENVDFKTSKGLIEVIDSEEDIEKYKQFKEDFPQEKIMAIGNAKYVAQIKELQDIVYYDKTPQTGSIFLEDASFSFDYAHILPLVEKCSILHGHTSSVMVELVGQMKNNLLVDFGVAKKIIKEVVNIFDHKFFINKKYLKSEDDSHYMIKFEGPKGMFELQVPKNTTYLLEGEATVENLSSEIIKLLAPKMPSNVEAVGVYIYEGYNKGSHIISNISR